MTNGQKATVCGEDDRAHSHVAEIDCLTGTAQRNSHRRFVIDEIHR